MPQAPGPIQPVDETDIIDSTASGMMGQLQRNKENARADEQMGLNERHQDTSDRRQREYQALAERQQGFREQEQGQATKERQGTLVRELMDKYVNARSDQERAMYAHQLAQYGHNFQQLSGTPSPSATPTAPTAGKPAPVAASDAENWQKQYMQGGTPAAPPPKPPGQGGGSDYGQLDKDLAGAAAELAPTKPKDITQTPYDATASSKYRNAITAEHGDSEEEAPEDGEAFDAYAASNQAGGLPTNFDVIMDQYMSGGHSDPDMRPLLPGQSMMTRPMPPRPDGGGAAPDWLKKYMESQ
jgi:hypothetical protein